MLKNEFVSWMLDFLSLIGVVMHMLGDGDGSDSGGGAAVSKFRIAVTLELLMASNKDALRPPSAPTSWLDELAAHYEASRQVAGAATTTTRCAGPLEGAMMWLLAAVFGLVSTLPPAQGRSSLDGLLMFGHRSFQEFLSARALMRHRYGGELLLLGVDRPLALLAEHDWASPAVVANQWWDHVWLFVACDVGMAKTFDLMMGGGERVAQWCDRLAAKDNDAVDVNDLGHVRLVTLLRCVAATSKCEMSNSDTELLISMRSLMTTIAPIVGALGHLMSLVGSDRADAVWSQLEPDLKKRELIADKHPTVDRRLFGLGYVRCCWRKSCLVTAACVDAATRHRSIRRRDGAGFFARAFVQSCAKSRQQIRQVDSSERREYRQVSFV